MSFRSITTLLIATALLATTVAPGAAACADPHCPWSPVTGIVHNVTDHCLPNVPDCAEVAIGIVRDAGQRVSDLVCDVLC